MALSDRVLKVLDGLEAEQSRRRERADEGQDVLPLWCLPRDAATLIHLLMGARQPERVLEVGTSAGYSGTWIAAALTGAAARLVTIEAEPRKIAMARQTFADAGVADRVQIVEGKALDVLSEIDGPFDAAFFDAVKAEYRAYFDLVAPKLSGRGLIVADNVLSHQDELGDYCRYVQSRPDFVSVTVPIGSGLEVSLKR